MRNESNKLFQVAIIGSQLLRELQAENNKLKEENCRLKEQISTVGDVSMQDIFNSVKKAETINKLCEELQSIFKKYERDLVG